MQSEMPAFQRNTRIVIHSLLPSLIGLIAYVFLAVLCIGGHLLAISVSGTAYPASFDENFLQAYANFVIQPVATLVNNELFGNLITILLWGITGSILGIVVGGLTSVLRDWRNTGKDITVPQEGVVVPHPLQRSLITHAMWRLFIGIVIVLFSALILPAIRFCLDSDLRAIESGSYASGFAISAVSALIWMAILHGYVILFRLYVLRTRLFGEILY